jgi:hypothetical protein
MKNLYIPFNLVISNRFVYHAHANCGVGSLPTISQRATTIGETGKFKEPL